MAKQAGEQECGRCNDTRYVCENCEQADGECMCDGGPELVVCDACDGAHVKED